MEPMDRFGAVKSIFDGIAFDAASVKEVEVVQPNSVVEDVVAPLSFFSFVEVREVIVSVMLFIAFN